MKVTQHNPMSQDASSLTDQMVLETPLTDTDETERQPPLDDSPNSLQPLASIQRSSIANPIADVNASDDIEHVGPESLTNPHAFVEAAADELMQEVFDDVDRMLDKGVVVSSTQPRSINSPNRQFSVASLNSGGALAPLETSRITDSEPTVLEEPQSDNQNRSAEPSTHIIKPREFWVRLFLIITASIGVGVGLALWIAQRNQATLATSPSSAIEASSSATGIETSSFLEYVINSLEVIDRRYELLARSGENPDLSRDSVDTIADDLNINGLSTDDNPQVIERVYIPVYQPQEGSASLPPIASAPLNQAATATPANRNTASAPIQNIAPNTTHTLVGTLELGDRSAAIFEYAGSAHRLEIGAQIGASGWSLVSVAGQEAIIRRNGEVRSIYMQQSF